MSMSFYAGCYFRSNQKLEDVFAVVYRHCKKHGFDYLVTERYANSFAEQNRRIANDEADSCWVSSKNGKVLVSIGNKPEKFDFPTGSEIALLHFIFDYASITTNDETQNQQFLESFVSLQTDLYLTLNAELGWGGYFPNIPEYEEYLNSEIKALYWYNILSTRFVEKIGRNKLLNAPGWRIKELAEGSVTVRLSGHPHQYKKVAGAYLHEYLGMNSRL